MARRLSVKRDGIVRIRYSLKGIFVIVTLSAICLGVATSAWRQARIRKAAVLHLRNRGATVDYDSDRALQVDESDRMPDYHGPDFVTRWFGIDLLNNVERVFFQTYSVEVEEQTHLLEEDVVAIKKLGTIQELWLHGTIMTDSQFLEFTSIASLRLIVVSKTDVSEVAVDEFRSKRPDVTIVSGDQWLVPWHAHEN